MQSVRLIGRCDAGSRKGVAPPYTTLLLSRSARLQVQVEVLMFTETMFPRLASCGAFSGSFRPLIRVISYDQVEDRFRYIRLEERVSQDHPLHAGHLLGDKTVTMSDRFETCFPGCQSALETGRRSPR